MAMGIKTTVFSMKSLGGGVFHPLHNAKRQIEGHRFRLRRNCFCRCLIWSFGSVSWSVVN